MVVTPGGDPSGLVGDSSVISTSIHLSIYHEFMNLLTIHLSFIYFISSFPFFCLFVLFCFFRIYQ